MMHQNCHLQKDLAGSGSIQILSFVTNACRSNSKRSLKFALVRLQMFDPWGCCNVHRCCLCLKVCFLHGKVLMIEDTYIAKICMTSTLVMHRLSDNVLLALNV